MRSLLGATLLNLALLAHAGAGAGDARRYSENHGGHAFLVWNDGKIVAESYAQGGGADKPENIYSITKSLCALSIFCAAGKGWLQLDEPASNTLSEWKGDQARGSITLRELLDQTSGLSPGYDSIYSHQLKNKELAVLRLPALASPGSTFDYGPAHYEALEAIMSRKLGRSTRNWVENQVLSPMGIHLASWRLDPKGHPFFSAGAWLTARELLTAGQIVRQQGRQWLFPILPPAIMRQISQGSDANPMYGLGFWLNQNASRDGAVERDVEQAISAHLSNDDWALSCLSKRAPADLIAMVGSYGQRVYVVPSRSLVVVRLGAGNEFRDPEFLAALFR